MIMAISQFIEALRVGSLYTYWAPLTFVIVVTMIREAVDDIRRWRRDREVNRAAYNKLVRGGQMRITAAEMKILTYLNQLRGKTVDIRIPLLS
ncbi:unnamed protein product [Protopolystoma xenopodis]|uniref:Uncharacterized protein n=1 Tax=Protopolystoma xenopodis TaxID=117903 RepID=A0A448XPH0_9PLAT|nr:unnamed protein product [Protopolystoma xenopodis]